MSPRLAKVVRWGLVLLALSLVFVAARKGQQARRYLSPLVELKGTVVRAEFADAIPMARGDPGARDVIRPVPTRLRIELREFGGVRFEVALREDAETLPALPEPGEAVTLVLPARWREMEMGDRVLAMGLKRGTEALVDPAGYVYGAEYRTAFLGVGALVGAAVCLIAALRLGHA